MVDFCGKLGRVHVLKSCSIRRRHQYIGKPRFRLSEEFSQNKRLVVLSEENVLASINVKSGQIGEIGFNLKMKFLRNPISYS